MSEQPPSADDDEGPKENKLPIPADDEEARKLENALRTVLTRLGIDPDEPSAQVIISAVHTRTFQGPIPSPDTLRQYGDVVPGLERRIVEAWDDERKHRHSLENRAFTGDEGRMTRAQYHALAVGLVGIFAASAVAIFIDGWVVPAVIAIVAVGGPNAATALSRLIAPVRLDRNPD